MSGQSGTIFGDGGSKIFIKYIFISNKIFKPEILLSLGFGTSDFDLDYAWAVVNLDFATSIQHFLFFYIICLCQCGTQKLIGSNILE